MEAVAPLPNILSYRTIQCGHLDVPTSAQAAGAPIDNSPGDNCPGNNCPRGTTAPGGKLPQATTAQVTTAPGGQLPLGDTAPSNCPWVTLPLVTAPSNLPLVMVMLGFLTIPWLG